VDGVKIIAVSKEYNRKYPEMKQTEKQNNPRISEIDETE
jgi:hypothetical protein